jgi:murein DD-endopeptidase MepM/ murein hydrolase activator NlpD
MRTRRFASTLAVAVLSLAGALAFITGRAPSPEITLSGSTKVETVEVEAVHDMPAKIRSETVTVRRGDTLVTLLSREGVGRRTSHEIATALQETGADLRRVRPRDELEISWTPEGEPIRVRWEPSPWLAFAAIATEGGWEVQRVDTQPDVRVEAIGGEVSRSLFEAVEALGESPRLVLDLVHIFESEFDFMADTRQGDRFRLLVEKRYAADQFVDYGRILAAQYLSEQQALTGVGHEAHDGRHGYYDLDARSLRKTFLRAPLAFTRITSGFTHRRRHPILGGVRPHLAIDYAAPIGTPVRAVADGVVLRAGWNGGNGIQVVVKHRSGYETMYNHLSKVVVKPGVRVSQRQIIGHVGSTGLSTGPHLDYRVSRRGRFVNPLSEKFLPGDSLAGSLRTEFERKAKRLVRRLEEEVPFEPVPDS